MVAKRTCASRCTAQADVPRKNPGRAPLVLPRSHACVAAASSGCASTKIWTIPCGTNSTSKCKGLYNATRRLQLTLLAMFRTLFAHRKIVPHPVHLCAPTRRSRLLEARSTHLCMTTCQAQYDLMNMYRPQARARAGRRPNMRRAQAFAPQQSRNERKWWGKYESRGRCLEVEHALPGYE